MMEFPHVHILLPISTTLSDRNVEGVTVDESKVKNKPKEIARVYGRQNRTKISYEYDAAGNRKSETYTDFGSGTAVQYDYSYYSGSDRLKSRSSVEDDGFIGTSGNYLDGIYRFGSGDQMGYKYDRAGNLTEKGNRYVLVGDNLTFTAQAGTGVHYWKYDYNAESAECGVEEWWRCANCTVWLRFCRKAACGGGRWEADALRLQLPWSAGV